SYTGIDQSAEVIEYCKSTLPQSYDLRTQDFLTDGLPEGYFDTIVASHVLEHIPHYKDLIPALISKKPKKLILITFAVLPELSEDIIQWDPKNENYHNSYAHGPFREYLEQEAGHPIQVTDYGELVKRSRWSLKKQKPKWYSRKVEMAWYV
ncbi:MAG: methyltransferase domain-containing protein, partial [Deltaproteobacteria bacterium]|nr:methyltransferase domain-containing protein [Deltaproteobacteria bacterium]